MNVDVLSKASRRQQVFCCFVQKVKLMSLVIQFRAPRELWPEGGDCKIAQPYPAKTGLPDWFKNMPAYAATNKKTVKICPPFLEAMVQGYVIPAPVDVIVDIVEEDDGIPTVVQRLRSHLGPEWALPFMGTHDSEQFPNAPWDQKSVLKLRNFWYLETPPGYSCLFVAPFNRDSTELPLNALPGVVETDRYKDVIHFPMLARTEFPIEIKQGTPLVQAIPFRREEWAADIAPATDETYQSIREFQAKYYSGEYRKFPEGDDGSNPETGYGAYQQLVKVQAKYK